MTVCNIDVWLLYVPCHFLFPFFVWAVIPCQLDLFNFFTVIPCQSDLSHRFDHNREPSPPGSPFKFNFKSKFMIFHPDLSQRHLLNDKYKRFVVVRVEVGVLDRCLLLLADPLALRVEQLDLHVGVRGSRDVHLLQFLAFQNANCQLKKSRSSHIKREPLNQYITATNETYPIFPNIMKEEEEVMRT